MFNPLSTELIPYSSYVSPTYPPNACWKTHLLSQQQSLLAAASLYYQHMQAVALQAEAAAAAYWTSLVNSSGNIYIFKNDTSQMHSYLFS